MASGGLAQARECCTSYMPLLHSQESPMVSENGIDSPCQPLGSAVLSIVRASAELPAEPDSATWKWSSSSGLGRDWLGMQDCMGFSHGRLLEEQR